MRVLFVTSEAHPLAKSGGLADVSSALPAALRRRNIDVRVLLPGYPNALAKLKNPRVELFLEPMLGVNDAALMAGEMPDTGVPVWLVHAPSLFNRSGGLYQDESGRDWPDNALRFGFLCRVATLLANGKAGWRPDVVHANDWHAGLVPMFLALQSSPCPATVFTTHNFAFQGNFPREVVPLLGIPEQVFSPDGAEFYGKLSFLKAALRYADKLTTVSPTYAREVLMPEFGCGMDGCLRERQSDFVGILNGIDDGLWNPESDAHLPATFSVRDIAGKRRCKAELQREFGMAQDADRPLIGFLSRLTHQKMADILIELLPSLAAAGAQFALVGRGDPALEAAFKALGARSPESFGIHVGYDEPIAHRLQAGADIMLAPARFEPCGLTQLYAMRYGTVPVVRRTGGLTDTVVDAVPASLADRTATGFIFEDATLTDFARATERALQAYREPLVWRRLQHEGMAQDFSWNASAEKYASLYAVATGGVESVLQDAAEAEDAAYRNVSHSA